MRAWKWAGLVAACAALVWLLWKTDEATPPAPGSNAAEHTPASNPPELDDDPATANSAKIAGRVILANGTAAPEGLNVALARQKDLRTRRAFAEACECEGCEKQQLAQACVERGPSIAPLFTEDLSRANVLKETTTLRGGRFVFDDLQPAKYALWATGERGSGIAFVNGVVLAAAENKEVELAFSAAGAISGVVITAAEGTPIADVRVIAVDLRIGHLVETRSDAAGRFELGALDQNQAYYVQADGEGWAAAEKFPAKAGDDVVLELARAASIEGVVTLDGKPRAGVTIAIDLDDREVLTDAAGKFSLTGLGAGEYALYADAAEGIATALLVELQAGEKRYLEIVLQKVCPFKVRVVDPEGEPAPDVQVIIEPKTEPRENDPRLTEFEDYTDDDGTIELDYLSRGKYILTASDENLGEVTKELEICRTPLVQLTLAGRPGIVGKVVDEEQQPIAGAAIELIPFEPGQGPDLLSEDARSTSSDKNGKFRIANLATGSWQLTVAKRDFKRAKLDLVRNEHAPDLTPTIVLFRGTTIRGRVVDAAQAPIKSWKVFAAPLDAAEPSWARSEKDGTFTLRGLEEGAIYQVGAKEPGGPKSTAIIEAKAGDEGIVLVEQDQTSPEMQEEAAREPVVKLTGRVIDEETRDPVINARVAYSDERPRSANPEDFASFMHHGYQAPGASTNSRGEFSMEVPEGKALLFVHVHSHAPVAVPIEVRANAEPVVVTVSRGVKISGVIQAPALRETFFSFDFKPITGGQPGDVYDQGRSDDSGIFDHRLPRAGRFWMTITAGQAHDSDGYIDLISVHEVDVPEQGLNDVSLVIPAGDSSLKLKFPPMPEGMNPRFADMNVTITAGNKAHTRFDQLPVGVHFRAFGEYSGTTVQFDHVPRGEYTVHVGFFFQREDPAIIRRVLVDRSGVVEVALTR